ncbi:uncharacterized protein LOC129892172 isoform X2 [Solanum dulcamara]|uniref:uncharacterized protein LOC129892172 isoform X2 n=2 Tax=Solanum dulcamara TaxID=45834 RepID=UPI0024864A31|nr:uncharacterized protein LOC129892172 isoform X2 [Solanum dulcamara]
MNLVTIKLQSVEDYLTWRTQFTSLLISHDLLGFVDGSFSPPSQFICDSSGNQQPNPNYRSWMRVDQSVRSWIFATLSRENIHSNFSSTIHSYQGGRGRGRTYSPRGRGHGGRGRGSTSRFQQHQGSTTNNFPRNGSTRQTTTVLLATKHCNAQIVSIMLLLLVIFLSFLRQCRLVKQMMLPGTLTWLPLLIVQSHGPTSSPGFQ